MQRTAAPNWRTSLVTRLAFLWALLAAGVVVVFGLLTYRGNREHLVQIRQEDLRHDMEMSALRLQSGVAAAMHDILFLSRTPLVREFLRQQGKPEGERSRALLEGELRALMEGRTSYTRARLIGGDEPNRELMSLQMQNGAIERLPRERLQQTLQEEDIGEAMRCVPGEVYLSEIRTSHEPLAEEPDGRTMLRLFVKISADHESITALLALDMNLAPLFAEMQASTGKGVRLIIADAAEGHDLFGADQSSPSVDGLPVNIFNEHVRTKEIAPGEEVSWRSDSGDVVFCSRFEISPGTRREIILAVGMPPSHVFAGVEAIRKRTLGATALAMALSVCLILLLARTPAWRLKRMTEVVASYRVGENLKLHDEGNDEVGVLARRFEEMAHKVNSQLTALEVARQAAEEATRMKEEFLAVVSHEIRTPMNAVFGLIRVLERSRPSAHQEPVLASLRAASKHLLSLLNDALDYTKLRTGRLEFEHVDFPLREVFADVALTHKPLALQKGIDLEFESAPNLPSIVNGDSVRLAQILNNLVSNALKFTESGFVRVRVREDADADGKLLRIVFEVEDSGMGIAPEDRERVFAPFLRAQGQKARRIEGAGLGLHITRTLVEMQGGEIRLRSELGKGSCFTVVLPFERAEQPAKVQGANTRGTDSITPDLRDRQILYVEDIASNREVMAVILEDSGATLITASTGAEALEELSEREFHVVLVDLQLPDMSGVELARRVRELRPEITMIAVTAQCSPKASEECRAVGISSIVTKPVEPARLFQALSKSGVCSVAGSGSLTRQLDELFGRDPARHRRVLVTVAREMREHRRVLRQAFTDRNEQLVRDVRHKMHSAIEQLSLQQMRTALDAAAAGNSQAQEDCLRLLDETATVLESRAETIS